MQATPVRLERSESNKKFANDGSYKSVENLLYKVAYRCFGRVQAMGVGMTFDDVLQEMNLSYVIAREQWDSERGVLFSTYLTTACYRNFNERIRRAEVERRNLGLVNFTDMRPRGCAGDDDGLDILESIDIEQDASLQVGQFYGDNFIEGNTQELEAPMSADPQRLHEAMESAWMQQAQAKVALRNLTDNAKLVVVDLLTAAKGVKDSTERLPRFSALLKDKGFSPAEIRRVRKELSSAFGVKV